MYNNNKNHNNSNNKEKKYHNNNDNNKNHSHMSVTRKLTEFIDDYTYSLLDGGGS